MKYSWQMHEDLTDWIRSVYDTAANLDVAKEHIRFNVENVPNDDKITFSFVFDAIERNPVQTLFEYVDKSKLKTKNDILEDLEMTVNNLKTAEENGKKHQKITDELLKTYIQKNTDYGDSFTKSLDEDGLLVAKIRLMDKMLRFNSLIKADNILVKDEPLEDTLLDMANYAIMTVMWMRDKQIDFQSEVSSNVQGFNVGSILELKDGRVLTIPSDFKGDFPKELVVEDTNSFGYLKFRGFPGYHPMDKFELKYKGV